MIKNSERFSRFMALYWQSWKGLHVLTHFVGQVYVYMLMERGLTRRFKPYSAHTGTVFLQISAAVMRHKANGGGVVKHVLCTRLPTPAVRYPVNRMRESICVCVFWLKEADIAAGALIITDRRRQFVDFTEPFLSLRSAALVRKPQSTAGAAQSSAVSLARRPHRGRRPRRTTTPAPRPTRGPVPADRGRIRTAMDLLRSSELSYGVVRDSVVHRHMSSSADSVTRALWARVTMFWPQVSLISITFLNIFVYVC